MFRICFRVVGTLQLIQIYPCTHVCVRARLCVHLCACARVCVRMHICVRVRVLVHVLVHVKVYKVKYNCDIYCESLQDYRNQLYGTRGGYRMLVLNVMIFIGVLRIADKT